MNTCDDIRARRTLYLDDELQGDERLLFESHLQNCVSCRSFIDSEQVFLDAIRQARPLRLASPELRERVKKLVSNTPAVPTAPPRLKQQVQRSLWQLSSNRSRLISGWSILTAAVLTILLLPVVAWWVAQHKSDSVHAPSDFALMAAETHLRHSRGQLPLEIVSEAPQVISDWFSNKVKFGVKLPNYQESSGQEKLYALEGARLVGYKDDYAAYVAYQMKTRPISLVITSDHIARASGGEEIKAKGLVFHYDTIHGLKVITWSDRGLTYALVSDLAERGQQSCTVCHQGTKDQDFITPLKPKQE
jgi:anti-sigma factor RsiW